MGQFSQALQGWGGTAMLCQAHLGAGELQRTRLTFLQQPLVKGLTPPRNLPVTCGMRSITVYRGGQGPREVSGPARPGHSGFVQLAPDSLQGQRYWEILPLFQVPVPVWNYPPRRRVLSLMSTWMLPCFKLRPSPLGLLGRACPAPRSLQPAPAAAAARMPLLQAAQTRCSQPPLTDIYSPTSSGAFPCLDPACLCPSCPGEPQNIPRHGLRGASSPAPAPQTYLFVGSTAPCHKHHMEPRKARDGNEE